MLKKPGLDPNDLKNFRPCQILEKLVLTQLQKHLSENDLLEIRQSAYKKKRCIMRLFVYDIYDIYMIR